MNNEIKASIIIPTKDKINRLRLVLKALENQVDESIEVIIIFDGNSRETLEAFYKLKFSFQPRVIILDQNRGRSAARNLGINQASGERIIFMDDDMIPAKDFVIKHLSGNNQRLVLMGITRDTFLSETEIEELYFGDKIWGDLSFLNEKSRLVNKPFLMNPLFKIFGNHFPLKWMLFFTNNGSVNRKDLLEIGGFDENFKGWGHEDVELAYRLHKRGLQFRKDPSIIAYHLAHGGNNPQKLNESIINLKYFLKEHREIIVQAWIRLLILKEKIIYYMQKEANSICGGQKM